MFNVHFNYTDDMADGIITPSHIGELTLHALSLGCTVATSPEGPTFSHQDKSVLVKLMAWEWDRTAGGGPSFSEEEALDCIFTT